MKQASAVKNWNKCKIRKHSLWSWIEVLVRCLALQSCQLLSPPLSLLTLADPDLWIRSSRNHFWIVLDMLMTYQLSLVALVRSISVMNSEHLRQCTRQILWRARAEATSAKLGNACLNLTWTCTELDGGQFDSMPEHLSLSAACSNLNVSCWA